MNAGMLQNGLLVIEQDWRTLSAVLFFIAWGVLLTYAALLAFSSKEDGGGLFALSLGGWPVPVLLLAIFYSAAKIYLPAFSSLLTLAIMGISIIYALRRVGMYIPMQGLWLMMSAAVLIILRIGFAASIFLPPYFDSATHYGIIRRLAEHTQWVWPTDSYYHIGYHLIIMMISSVGALDVSRVMLLFGQIILALLPFPVYFFVRRAADSRPAAWFAVMLAAFGWYMPAFSVNWGKYPALLSLLVIQFSLGLLWIKKSIGFVLSLSAALVIHTRSVIVIPLFAAAWILSELLRSQKWQAGILFAGLGGMLLFAGSGLAEVYEPYLALPTVLALLPTLFHLRSFSRQVLFGGWAILGISLLTQVPVLNSNPLLDRPLAEMLLFLPLAFLGGVGAARKPVMILVPAALLIMVHAFIRYDLSPSACCQLADADDIAALAWMDETLGEDAKVAIAGADLAIDSVGMVMQSAGVDAGTWIPPLTDRAVIPLLYVADFRSQAVHEKLCLALVTHIYIGSRPQSFHIELIADRTDWYQLVFERNTVRVFQVIGCDST